MLTSIRLGNYKCFDELKISPRLITVLIGANGTGKSGVLQALMLLRQSIGDDALRFDGPFVNMVGFNELVFGRDPAAIMSIGFGGRKGVARRTVTFEYEANFAQGSIVRNHGELTWDKAALSSDWRRGNGKKRSEFQFGPTSFTVGGEAAVGRPLSVEGMSQGPGVAADEVQQAQTEFYEVVATFEQVMSSWRFVPPLRGFAHPAYSLVDQKLTELKPAGPYDAQSAAVASTLGIDDAVEERVAGWVEKITDVRIRHAVQERQHIAVRAASNMPNGSIPIVNEGFGTNQLVFLMFQLATTPPDGLTAIEEPEIHLHPYAVARLSDLFVQLATKERKQLLLATHSEHLLLGLLNNVAEGKLKAQDLAIYSFSRDQRRVTVSVRKVTPEGMVKGGLPGFFDAALEAQRRHLKALAIS